MPYSEKDDYLVHQTTLTLDEVVNKDLHFTDRFYFNCHAKDGSVLLTTGYGNYPNRGFGSGYAKLALADGRYWDYAAYRELGNQPNDAFAGALKYTVLEPMKRWRLQLEPNKSGLSYDIEYQARAPLWHLKPIHITKNDKVIVDQQHIQQSAYYEGEVTAGSETFSVNGFYGGRDRTWGVRNHAQVDMWIWFAAQFDDRAIAAWLWESKDGTLHYVDGGFSHEDGTLSERFISFKSDIEFEGSTKRPKSANIVFTDESGKEYRLKATAEHQNACVYYGFEMPKAPDGFPVDKSNAAALADIEKVSMSNDQLMRYEMDGMVGYGIFETWVCGNGYDAWAKNYPLVELPSQ